MRRQAKLGDIVRIIECRPLSKLKRWRLGEVIRRAAQVGAAPKELDVEVAARSRDQREAVEAAGVLE